MERRSSKKLFIYVLHYTLHSTVVGYKALKKKEKIKKYVEKSNHYTIDGVPKHVQSIECNRLMKKFPFALQAPLGARVFLIYR